MLPRDKDKADNFLKKAFRRKDLISSKDLISAPLVLSTIKNVSRHSFNTLFINSMNIVGALVRPNDITTNSLWSYLVLNSVLGKSHSLVLTWCFPDRRSILENIFASLSWSNKSSI